MVKIEIHRVDQDFRMEAVNDKGNSIIMDAGASDGGHDSGLRPMQLLLAAMGGCSAIDLIGILRKQREPLTDLKITVTGEREQGVVPSLYTEVHVHFRLFGNINQDKAERAVELSVEKYCSVAKTLEKTAVVTHSFEIIKNV
ncbi:MAG TPA: OsmC family protein [Cyclobacteriaceae bacterium]|nr:OsmC family protein [Cyclobacteriaceae bacterium]HPW64134.1 OsmC family protein [Cyclobacteriaceae bacterium]HRG80317.1 OsmC family protein [Cyclobacteriaceae bacterium]